MPSRISHAINDALDFVKENPNSSVTRRQKKILSTIRAHGITPEVYSRAVADMLGRKKAQLARLEAELEALRAKCNFPKESRP